jgi:hypothetical protein
MSWPASQDYNEAIQSPATSFSDPELKGGRAITNALGIPRPLSGNFADVYEFECPQTQSKWAIKCFTRKVNGLRERYAEISRFLRQAGLPFMVPFRYIPQGIRVRGKWYPILKMRWIEGQLLNEFVRANLDRPARLQALSDVWKRMARRLREVKIAHADLQHGNVMLVPGTKDNSLAIKLIDYDGMVVPALSARPSGEVGHPNYQHPQRLKEGTYNAEVDRFPVLVVATALRALTVGGAKLWEQHDNGDNLLFKESDLRAPAESALFNDLRRIGDAELCSLVELLTQAAGSPLAACPLVEEMPVAAKPSLSPKNGAPRQRADSPKGRVKRLHARRIATLVAGGVALLGLVICVAVWATQPESSLAQADDGGGTNTPAQIPGSSAEARHARTPEPIEEVRRFDAGEWGGHSAVCTPDDALLIAAGTTTVRSWQVSDGRLRSSWDRVSYSCITVDSTGRLFAAGKMDGTIDLWDLEERSAARTFSARQGNDRSTSINAVAFSPDAKRLLSAGSDHSVRHHDVEKGQEISRVDQFDNATGVPRCLAFSPDGTSYLIGNSLGNVRVMTVADNKEVLRFTRHKDLVSCVAVAPDNRRAISGSWDGTIRVWEMKTGKELGVFDKHMAVVNSLGLSEDGKWVVSGGKDNVVRVWGLEDCREVWHFEGHQGEIMAVGFLRKGPYAFSYGKDPYARLWRLPQMTALQSATTSR